MRIVVKPSRYLSGDPGPLREHRQPLCHLRAGGEGARRGRDVPPHSQGGRRRHRQEGQYPTVIIG